MQREHRDESTIQSDALTFKSLIANIQEWFNSR